MVTDGRGRLFRRKDEKFLIYLPKDLAEDYMFPFKGSDSIFVKVGLKMGDDKLLVEKWVPPLNETNINQDWSSLSPFFVGVSL